MKNRTRILTRSIQVDAYGNWYNGYQKGVRASILRIFDAWIRQPGEPIFNIQITKA